MDKDRYHSTDRRQSRHVRCAEQSTGRSFLLDMEKCIEYTIVS